MISCLGKEVAINRGLKQEDPLSPSLFNIVLNKLLQDLSTKREVTMGDYRVSALVYADDIILLADNVESA